MKLFEITHENCIGLPMMQFSIAGETLLMFYWLHFRKSIIMDSRHLNVVSH